MNTADQLQNAIESVSQALSPGELSDTGRPDFSFNGLATPPLRPARKFFGLYSLIEVPPGTCGVCHGPNGSPLILPPGIHWLNNKQGVISAVQLVDATQRRWELLPVSGLTADGWRVTLHAVLVYEVVDPAQAARTNAPMDILEAAGRAAILSQIESMTHEALIGSVWTARNNENQSPIPDGPTVEPQHNDQQQITDATGLRFVEAGILARLNERPSLSGLNVIDVAIIEREGDERLVEIVRTAEIERTQVVEERQTEVERTQLAQLRLDAEAKTAATARAAALIEAETRSQLAAIEEQLKIQAAHTEADIQEIHQIQEARESDRKRLAEEWRTAKQLDLKVMEYQHEETMAVIQGTAQVTAEAAKTGMLENVENKLWPQPGGARVVGEGLQVLKGFREKIAPPITRFLPQPVDPNSLQNRLAAESLRLARIPNLEHEMVLRHGRLSAVRAWFTAAAPDPLAGVQLEFACPDDYPFTPPLLTILQDGVIPEQQVPPWQPELFLADLVRELMLKLIQADTRREEEE